jgi:hypothetical protein
MTSPIKRGEPGSQVSEWFPLSNKVTVTQAPRIPIVNPYGLPVRHTLCSALVVSVATGGGTATFTAQNKFKVGDSVIISGVTPSGYNGTFTVIAANNTTFAITNATATGITGIGCATLNTAPVFPSGVTWVWAVCVGGGMASSNSAYANGSGGVAAGWALAGSNYVIGEAGVLTGATTLERLYTRYGHIMAGAASQLGGGGSAILGGGTQGTNFWGQPAALNTSATGTIVYNGVGAGGSIANNTTALIGLNGSGGISGGNGQSVTVGTGNTVAGNGGNGYVGGGGGQCNSNGTRTGGNGGSGIGIDGTIYTGGLGSTGTNANGAGGGGAGMAANGLDAIGTKGGHGGLGGGAGGASISGLAGVGGGGGLIYLCY